MRISDWSSDVCSSDLAPPEAAVLTSEVLTRDSLLEIARRRKRGWGSRSRLAAEHFPGACQKTPELTGLLLQPRLHDQRPFLAGPYEPKAAMLGRRAEFRPGHPPPTGTRASNPASDGAPTHKHPNCTANNP